jgi:hypothetical protein
MIRVRKIARVTIDQHTKGWVKTLIVVNVLGRKSRALCLVFLVGSKALHVFFLRSTKQSAIQTNVNAMVTRWRYRALHQRLVRDDRLAAGGTSRRRRFTVTSW